MPSKLRELFAIILEFCSVENVANLYEEFIEDLSADYRHRHGEHGRDYAYYDIESRLLEPGRAKFQTVNSRLMPRPGACN